MLFLKLFFIIIFISFLLFVLYFVEYKKEYKLEDVMDPHKWKHVYVSLLRKHLRFLDNSDVSLTKTELFNYGMRFIATYNKGCLTSFNNKCVTGCGCKTIDKINARTDFCYDCKYNKFMSEEELNEFLNNYKLKINYTITKIEKK